MGLFAESMRKDDERVIAGIRMGRAVNPMSCEYLSIPAKEAVAN